jgi:hypothetical protein
MSTEVITKNGKVLSDPGPAPDFFTLLGIAQDAVRFNPPLYISSIFGRPWEWVPPHHRYSEFKILDPWRLGRTLKYLVNISLPSIPRKPPAFGFPLINRFYWQPSVILQRPDHYGGYTSFPEEAWFFVNGILTNDTVARSTPPTGDLFPRPITLIQNSTGSLFEDLLECMLGKEWYRTTEAAVKAFPPIYDALKSRSKERVVVICHSQGTIILAVVLRMLLAITRSPTAETAAEQAPGAESFGAPYAEPEFVYPQDEPILLEDFDPLEADELAKLEIYAFANCANRMTYHPTARKNGRPVPWIESYGNELDLVARLGMLAPRPERWGIQIDGPRYELPGKWGHLLNEHYLTEIEKPRPGYVRSRGSKPYCLAGSGGGLPVCPHQGPPEETMEPKGPAHQAFQFLMTYRFYGVDKIRQHPIGSGAGLGSSSTIGPLGTSVSNCTILVVPSTP